MRFARFGVTLQRLAPQHLEQVRAWRNGDWVRPRMRFRDVIGAEDQLRWFAGLDPRRDWYFVARLEERPYALFHIKAIDWERGSGESGGFVGDASLIGRPEPAQATLALMDFAFLVLQLRSLEAQYCTALRRVARFNQQLGYRVVGQEGEGFVRAEVTAERYFACACRLRHIAARLYGSAAILTSADAWLLGHLARGQGVRPEDFQLRVVSGSPS